MKIFCVTFVKVVTVDLVKEFSHKYENVACCVKAKGNKKRNIYCANGSYQLQYTMPSGPY